MPSTTKRTGEPTNPPLGRAERRWLEGMHRRYHHRHFVEPDPLQFLFRYADLRDREVAAVVASALAYGNVKAMLPAIARVLDGLGPAPARRLRDSSPREIERRLGDFRYRFTTGAQLAGLLEAVGAIQREAGTLDERFALHVRSTDETVIEALGRFVDDLAACAPCSLRHLVPHPAAGSACKRMLLMLRWLVRSDDVDPGGWRSARPDQLVMPLDTHVHRTARRRGWTTRASADLRTALAVTAVLRRLRPEDPLRYDFAITRPGIRGS
ncbi:MAG: TIGR02757 family protein [Planctomycetes bacterium]|nr:TIGR02757 family protein [Planctomycetota bacterium]